MVELEVLEQEKEVHQAHLMPMEVVPATLMEVLLQVTLMEVQEVQKVPEQAEEQDQVTVQDQVVLEELLLLEEVVVVPVELLVDLVDLVELMEDQMEVL